MNLEPGPGAYDVRSTIGTGKGAVLLGKYKELRRDTHEVGFLNIDDKAIRKNSPVATLRGKSSNMLELTSNRFVPGPGQYNVHDPRIKTTGFLFGNAPQLDIKKQKDRYQSPGPGSYQYKDKFGQGAKAVTILGRNRSFSLDQKKSSSLPGPGTYTVNDRVSRTSAPSFTIKGAISEDPIVREK